MSLLDGADYNALDNTVISVNAGNTAATLDLQPGGSGAWQPAASPQVTIGADSFTLYNYVDGASILATVAVQAEVTVVGGGGVIYG